MRRAAVVSACGSYRYTLEREWQPELGAGEPLRCLFVMLNPSTADAHLDDPTVRRCVAFARSWGYSSLAVGNLFAFRATDPAELAGAADPVGRDNDAWLARLATEASLIVCAWGSHVAARDRARAVAAILCAHGPLYSLGLTRSGAPRHPLYVPGVAIPQPYLAGPRPVGAVSSQP